MSLPDTTHAPFFPADDLKRSYPKSVAVLCTLLSPQKRGDLKSVPGTACSALSPGSVGRFHLSPPDPEIRPVTNDCPFQNTQFTVG